MRKLKKIEKLEKILQDHERRISKLETHTKSIPVKNTDEDISQTLTELVKDSFFNKPRKYGEIIRQLKTNATFSSKVNYKAGLQKLVKGKIISRKISNHQWVYFKNTN